jgi:hypothetical protein
MVDDTDIRAFVHERYRRTDEKLDKVIEGITELRQMVSGIVQILASHDQQMLSMEVRLGRIERSASTCTIRRFPAS